MPRISRQFEAVVGIVVVRWGENLWRRGALRMSAALPQRAVKANGGRCGSLARETESDYPVVASCRRADESSASAACLNLALIAVRR